MIQFSYDKEGDILEIKFSDKKIAESEYIKESGIVVDYDIEHNIVALEIISFSKRVRKSEDIQEIAV